ncbi:hypothetical protein TNCT_84561 [Trichonephila clavata]|uniref:Uncharacterized protein n=1 Tax=Trichonephila clavata TaxID=2740835 RepID=A0A8X6LGV1_TRICU|nr:hypothetical protein TNCT_84561 [Trichonephila clavata]
MHSNVRMRMYRVLCVSKENKAWSTTPAIISLRADEMIRATSDELNRFTNHGPADMHLAYGAADESGRRARQVYENQYLDRRILRRIPHH